MIDDSERRFRQAHTEVANRAEATALLVRAGYRVYRPEADVEGEDLIVREPQSRELRAVQLKGRPIVDKKRYGDRNIWMLFPSASYNPSVPRDWYLIPHDEFLTWVTGRHSSVADTGHWSYPTISKALAAFLQPFIIFVHGEGREDRFQATLEGATVTRDGVTLSLAKIETLSRDPNSN